MKHSSDWMSANQQLGTQEVCRPSAYRSLEIVDEASERQAIASVVRSVKSLMASGQIESAKNLASSLSPSPVKESLRRMLTPLVSPHRGEDNECPVDTSPRQWGQYAGLIQMDDSFDELPEDFMRHFES